MAGNSRLFSWRTWAAAFVAAALLAALSAGPASAAKEAKPSFFNSKETESTNLKPFKKWLTAIERYTRERAKMDGSCKTTKMNKCHYNVWMAFLKKTSKLDKMSQIKEVNRYMNQAKYITDKNNWGKKDYWSSPGEFFARFGDCEDYAIAKFLSLKLLGFKSDEIRVVAVKDLNLKVGHAIMVVFLDGKPYVLDNQIKQVVAANTIKHYQPVFSISLDTWWRHRM